MIRGAIAAGALAVSLGAVAGQPVAFVADVSGNATIEGDGKVAFLAELEDGMRLFLGTGSRVTVTYAGSGSQFTMAGPGEYLVSANEVRAEKGAVAMRQDVSSLRNAGVIARVSRSATASLRMRGVEKRVSDKAPASILEYPVDTRVATLRPTLRWRANGVKQATLTLRDESGKSVWSARAARGSVIPAVKLSPATGYVWTVATPKGQLGEARFETLAADALERAEKSRLGARTFPERVLHALVLHDLGAEQDARDAWAGLARERPDLPELARLANAGGRSGAP